MKKLLLKLKPAHIVIAALGIFAVAGIAQAGSTFSWARAEQWAGKFLADKVSAPVVVQPEEEVLGAVTGPELPNPTCQAGLCTFNKVGAFIDASTTIVSIPSPFLKVTSTGAGSEVIVKSDEGGVNWTAATTTVNMVRLDVTGAATTSYYVHCGASATPAGILANLTLLNIVSSTLDTRVPTSSVGFIENNVSQALGAMSDGGSVSKIMLGSSKPWLVCIVNPTVALGFTNALNTFDGKVTASFNKTR
jgi:hypothetical protein